MINQDDARKIATDVIRRFDLNRDLENVIIDERFTREASFGWIFAYNHRQYIETGNGLYALCGNLPIVVLRIDGRVMYLPWKKSYETSISAFEAQLKAAE